MNFDRKGVFYVIVQLSLIVAYLLNPSPVYFTLPSFIALAGFAIAVLGLGLTMLATLQLNTRLSPLPAPRKDAILLKTAAYKYVRHPIYCGLFLFGLGWAIYDGNGFRLAIAFALLGLFYFKAKYEEQLLLKTFDDYPAYQAKTGMLFPRIMKNGAKPRF